MIVVAVEQAFQHCPKALVRSDLWKAGRGDRPKGVPTLGDFAAAEVRPGKLTGPSYSNAKMRFQSFFMLITVQDRVFASSISD